MKQWPINPNDYKKGQIIPELVCREIIGQTKNFQLSLLSLRDKIETIYRSLNDTRVIRVCGKGLLILDDAGAVEYLREQANIGDQKINRATRRLIHDIDRTMLNDQQRIEHDAAINLNAFRVFALKKARIDSSQKNLTNEDLRQLE